MTAERRHIRIDLGYDGTDFFGSQRQSDRRTVQQVVEEALSRLSNQDVRIDLAGRTDRGVHALGQVASGDVCWRGEEETLRYALDSLTPDDVSILGVSRANDSFHARFSVLSREYRFRIWNGPYPATLLKRFVWHSRDDLDIVAMRNAAELLRGEHNFAAFTGAGLGVPWSGVDCVRLVFQSDWRSLPTEWESGAADSRLLEYRIRSTGFLPHMVRNIVGSLCAVGRGSQSLEWFASVLAEGDRRRAAAPAPPNGLILWSVEYPEQ